MRRDNAARGMKVYSFEIYDLAIGRTPILGEFEITMLGPRMYKVERLDGRGQHAGLNYRGEYNHRPGDGQGNLGPAQTVKTLPYEPTPALAIERYIKGRQQNISALHERISIAEGDMAIAEAELRKGQGHT